MAGEYRSVSADGAKQEATATEVVKGFDVMTESAEGASALGTAQKNMFWGHETSPYSMQGSSTEIFNAVSELLEGEAALISTFEAEINAMPSSFTGTEHKNKAQMEKISQALDRVAESDAVVALEASTGQFSKTLGVSITSSAVGALVGSLSGKLLMNGGLPRALSGGPSEGATSQTPTQDIQPTVWFIFLTVERTLYMVSSPMYERLKVFMEAAHSNRDLDTWDIDHKKMLKSFEEATERLKCYSDNQGSQGQTADAMNQRVAESPYRINMARSIYEAGHTTYGAGRSMMVTALKEVEMVSLTFLDSTTEAMRDSPVVMVPSSSPGGGVSVLGKHFTISATHADAVEAQANVQREAVTRRVLSMVNERAGHIAALMRQQVQLSEQVKQRTDYFGTADGEVAKGISQRPYSEDQGFGRTADRNPSSANYPGGFAQPWWDEASTVTAQDRTVTSGAIPTQEPAHGELGLRASPITDPWEPMGMDLLHIPANSTAYRSGVVGGHTPAPPTDTHYPLWCLNGGVVSNSAMAGRLGGAGVLGAGVPGLHDVARMGSGSLGESGSLDGSSVFGRFGGSGVGTNGLGGPGSAGGMSGASRMGTTGMRGIIGSTSGLDGAGAADFKVGSYLNSGFGFYTPLVNSAGTGGADGTTGSSSVTGATGVNGGGAAGAAGVAGKDGAASGSFMGAGTDADAGADKDDKKGRKNRYVALEFDDDEDELSAGCVNPLSQISGTGKNITPAKRNDDGWDPRQW